MNGCSGTKSRYWASEFYGDIESANKRHVADWYPADLIFYFKKLLMMKISKMIRSDGIIFLGLIKLSIDVDFKILKVLYIGGTTLEDIIWLINLKKLLRSNVVQLKTKCYTLMCVNQWPIDAVLCGIEGWFSTKSIKRFVSLTR